MNWRLGLTPRLVGTLAGCSRYAIDCVSAGCIASLSVAWPNTELRLAGILGFSERFGIGAGRGRGFAGASLRNSPDLLGGGGSGGCEAGEGDNNGGFRDSTSGVCGLLGILKCLGDATPGAEADIGVSGAKEPREPGIVKLRLLGLGGDFGGSIVTAGEYWVANFGPVDTGLWRPTSAAAGGSRPEPFCQLFGAGSCVCSPVGDAGLLRRV